MTSFDRVIVIFNPQSTGDAPRLAKQLKDDITERVRGVPVQLQPTEHAGHARTLARDAATVGRPLIVSVSGDGGYNEVVDGVMQSGSETAVCAVMAAGNANDHRRATRRQPLIEAIADGQVRRIDLLQLTLRTTHSETIQYAHSYIGLGLTPIVAIDLEKGGKGSIREAISVVRTFAKFRPFEVVQQDGTRARFDSLVFANIREMAKYASLSADGRPDDGRFEVIALPHTAKWRVLLTAVTAVLRGLHAQRSVTRYEFRTTGPAPLQLDGEVVELEPDTTVTVQIAPHALATLG